YFDIIFFFSSRRRHTRLQGDWSSDVCSSDLTERKLIADYEALLGEIMEKLTPENHHIAVGLANIPEKIRGFGHVKARHLVAAKRSEERRVGKECRARWGR